MLTNIRPGKYSSLNSLRLLKLFFTFYFASERKNFTAREISVFFFSEAIKCIVFIFSHSER